MNIANKNVLILANGDWEGKERIVIYGALGGRLDHTLANISLLEKGLGKGIKTEIVTDRERVVLISGKHDISDAQVGDRISLLAVSDKAIGILCRACDQWWSRTLNRYLWGAKTIAFAPKDWTRSDEV